jgi:hypothetical protein
MKFLQALAGLALLFPLATVGDHTETEWGIDMTPDDVPSDKPAPDAPGGARALEPIQHGRQLPVGPDTYDAFCNGEVITRDVTCGGYDEIGLTFLVDTNYTIDVQRGDCELLDPSSLLFAPDGRFLALSDDVDFPNLPSRCLSDEWYSDPHIIFITAQAGVFHLGTYSLTFKSQQKCTAPGLPLLR